MNSNQITLTELEIVYQPGKITYNDIPISSSKIAHRLLLESFDANSIFYQEECVVMYLRNNCTVLGIQKLSKGGINSTIVDIRIILGTALKTLSTAIILAHNHPSGKLIPSTNDKLLTKQLEEACKLFDIKLLDHLIVSPLGTYFSFADDGLITT